MSDGTSSVFTLEDEPSLQKLAVSGTAEWVRFDVVDIYSGTKSDDTYISLVDFGNEPAPEFDTFSNLLIERAPPTTEPSDLPGASSTDAVINTVYPTTSIVAAARGSSTVSTPTSDSTRDHEQPERLLWPAILGAVVVAIGLGALTYLVVRLRRS